MNLLPAPLLRRGRGFVPLPLFEGDFAAEVAEVLEPLGGSALPVRPRPAPRSRARSRARSRRSGTLRELGDVFERLGDRRLVDPRLQLAHARRVDEQRSARQLDKVPRRRRMAPLAVDVADLGGFQQLVAEQPVDERRFSDAGRTDEGHRLGGREVCVQCGETVAVFRADGQDVDERQARADIGRLRLRDLR